MAKNLVIVESPAKAKKIEKFLGKDYRVMASVGHIRDLPPKRLGVSIKKKFEPSYTLTKNGKKTVKKLKQEANKCERIFLAPDPDREGEAIAWHLKEALAKCVEADDFYRVTYNEITKKAIKEAFANPTQLDMNRVNSQQARRILDRLVGFKGSKRVKRQIKGANSVGRVQTVALRLVCNREDAINNFKPKAYWVVGARVQKKVAPRDPFALELSRINGKPTGIKNRQPQKGAIRTKEQLMAIQAELDECSFEITNINERETKRRARPPFNTSTLQQAASGKLRFSPKRTMGIAQKLYEAGLITYMRTDSFHIAQGAQAECRSFVKKKFGPDYCPPKPNYYRSKGGAQEAHEAIRPTDLSDSPQGLKPEQQKLYKLIRERFIASQMAPARIAQKQIEVETGRENTYLFRASTSEVIFPGYMKASGMESSANKQKNGNDGGGETDYVPPLKEGEALDWLEWLSEQRETQPPNRYSQAALIKELEKNGVGRPSTYASIMAKLDERKYVSHTKRSLVPTKLGMNLIEMVRRVEKSRKKEQKTDLFRVDFTADMENRLDSIEAGRLDWREMLSDFYPFLQAWLENSKEYADPERVAKQLESLKSVTKWVKPTKRYNDQEIVADLAHDFEKDEKLTKRQSKLLYDLGCKYIDQIPEKLVKELKLVPQDKPKEETFQKFEILKKVEFAEPTKSGKRTYDDKGFVGSLEERARSGKKLTEKQVASLDRLMNKYSKQIENFAEISKRFRLEEKKRAQADPSTKPILELLSGVKEWNEPVKRGKRTFDDNKFYKSLASQFAEKGSLSAKQRRALKNIAARYADQIANYTHLQEKLGLPKPKQKKKSAKSKEKDS